MTDWDATLADLQQRRRRSLDMGGTQRLAAHRARGKLDARARVTHLLDDGSFREIGTLVGGENAADGIVTGSGTINGTPVLVGAEDFTTVAGTIGSGSNAKRHRIAELAVRNKIPMIMLLEGAGFRPGKHGGRSPPTSSPRPGARVWYPRWQPSWARQPGTARWWHRCATSGS